MKETSLLNERAYHWNHKVTPIKRISHSMSCSLGYNLQNNIRTTTYVEIKYNKEHLWVCCHCYYICVTLK